MFLLEKIGLSLRQVDTMKINFIIQICIIMKKNNCFSKSILVLTCLFASVMFVSAQSSKSLPQLGKSPVKDVIAAMTLEEKAKLVVGNGFRMPGITPQGPTIGYSFHCCIRWTGGFKNTADKEQGQLQNVLCHCISSGDAVGLNMGHCPG